MSTADLAKRVLPAWSKEVARDGLRIYGTATGSRRPLPDYLVIGTKRGGTTSLWRSLRRHPQVMSLWPEAENLKSPHFFDIHFCRGVGWYRAHLPSTRARARQARRAGGRVVVGDASPYYLFHPRAAERARQVVPEARIIVLLRNPVDRAWSHFHERRKNGTEPLTFSEALDAEESRLGPESLRMAADEAYYSEVHDYCSYLARGRYLDQLEPWLTHFGDQVLVLRSEDYYERPRDQLERVFDFLGIAPDVAVVPEHLNSVAAEPMPAEVRLRLATYYRPHVAALESALGRDFCWDLEGGR